MKWIGYYFIAIVMLGCGQKEGDTAQKTQNTAIYTVMDYNQFEQYLEAYFSSDELLKGGIPTITQCGAALNMSGRYLSDLLKLETGRSAKDHIQVYVVEKAKTQLLSSNESISQIAFGLGFGFGLGPKLQRFCCSFALSSPLPSPLRPLSGAPAASGPRPIAALQSAAYPLLFALRQWPATCVNPSAAARTP